ncbi:MAG: NUDIX hydrolase [Gammaproteobacteria bacterium]
MNAKTIDSVPVPSVGVSGIVFNRRQEVLMIRRNKPPALGLWSVPGGKVEPGESFTAACQREINEETGLDTQPLALVAVVERRIEGFHYIVIDFLARLVSNENVAPIARTDVSDVRWVSMEKLNDYELVPGLKEIIIRTHRVLQEGKQPGLTDDAGLGTDFVWPAMRN